MTTASWASSISHTNDTEFRAWGSEINSYLSAVGFVQTADTGQINWTTATRPAVNTVAGYEVWRFSDSLQATAPIFFLLEYGTAAVSTYPIMYMTVGTGSDGAGALTGIQSARRALSSSGGTSAGSYNCYACHAEGCGFLAFLDGESGSRYRVFFAIARTWDTSGDETEHGAVFIAHHAGSSSATNQYQQPLRFASPAAARLGAGGAATDAGNIFSLPGTDTNTSVGGDTQATVCIADFPEFKVCGGLGVAMLSELSVGSTASITFVGATARTYIQLGVNMGRTGARMFASDDQLVGLLALWE